MSDNQEQPSSEELVQYIGQVEDPNAGDIIMYTSDQEMLRLKGNGDILVKGHKAGSDKQVVDTFVDFVRQIAPVGVKLWKLSEAKAPGLYLNVLFTGNDPNVAPTVLDLRYRSGEPILVELDKEGVWRSETGHGITLEDPDYFKEGRDFFIGPILAEEA